MFYFISVLMELPVKIQPMEHEELEKQMPSEKSEVFSRKQFSCGICQSIFSNGAKLWQHRKVSHQLDLSLLESSPIEECSIQCASNGFQCNFCEKSFSTKSNQYRHIKSVHKQNISHDQGNGNLKCSECLHAFLSHASFIEHFSSSHPDIDIKKEILLFPSTADFDLWKTKVEKETAASYIVKRRKKSKNGTITYYNCHRSGNFISESNNVRHLKRGGSCKINSYCPSRIKVVSELNAQEGKEIINVEFYSKHVGHKCDVSYLRIPKDEKNKIATKIADGVPFQEIILSTGSTSPSKRLSITTMQDLRNIASTYGINRDTVRFSYLEIQFNETEEREDREKKAISKVLNKTPRKSKTLQNDFQTAVSNLVSLVENNQNEEILQYALSAVTKVTHTVRALGAKKKLLPVNSRHSGNKKIQPQRKFPAKKKSNKMKQFVPKNEALNAVLTFNKLSYK